MDKFDQNTRAYLFLTGLVITGIIAALITAGKVIHFGVNFTFGDIVFSMLTYPIIDCICELWGKQAARRTLLLGLFSQVLLTAIIQLSIVTPPAEFWTLQPAYKATLAIGLNVLLASLLSFSVAQLIDISVFQNLKQLTRGRFLWLRSNTSLLIGQALDTFIFINIVFFDVPEKWSILLGSLVVKMIISIAMTPVVYAIVYLVNAYLGNKSQAFRVAYSLA
jgi:queuosine precursor transporter